MNEKIFYLVADYTYNGIDKHNWYGVAAENADHAVEALLVLLERDGADVHCITEVVGCSSMEELADTVDNGHKPGLLYVAHVFDEEG